MRVSSIYRGEAIYEAKPELIQGRVVSIDVSTGLAVYKVIDNYGNTYKNVTQINPVGNTIGFMHSPIQINQNVILLSVAKNSPPYILGSIYKPPKIEINKDDVSVSSGEDNDTLNHSDFLIANGGQFINVSKTNGVTISSSDILRLQLKKAASVLRISAEGLDNDDNPLNGQSFIDALFAYLDVLEAKVNSNSQFVEAAGPGVKGAYEALATLADASAPGTGQPFRDKGDEALDASIEAAVPLATTSAQTKTQCEATKNTKIIMPQD